MNAMIYVLQLIVGLGILNVWLLRRNKATPYRGGSATNMKEEFAHYGLPLWSVSAVGISKIVLALVILGGFADPKLIPIGAGGLAVFMAVAVFMHLKVKDSFAKTAPSLLMLAMCLVLVFASQPSLTTVAGF